MREFCWKLVGADCFILSQSARESQKAFFVLGMLYAFLATLTFISFFGLFLGIFDGFFMSLFGATVFSFIISNLYRLVIITLEPSTLPVAKEHKVKFLAYFVRVSIVIILAIFISKVLETMLFGHLAGANMEAEILRPVGNLNFNQFDNSRHFMEHLIKLNLDYPQINVITFIIVCLYVAPVIIKHRLKKGNQYYQMKRKIDKHIVQEEYQKMLQTRADLLQDVCLKNNRPYHYQAKYEDEPFNIHKIKRKQSESKDQSDFLTLFD